MYNKTAEFIMLCINFGVSIFIVLKFAKYDQPLDLRKDRLIFWMPVFMHLYAIVSSLILGINKAFPAIIVVMVIHCGYLVLVYKKLRENNVTMQYEDIN